MAKTREKYFLRKISKIKNLYLSSTAIKYKVTSQKLMQSGYQVDKMVILIHFDSQNWCKKNRMKKKKFIVTMKARDKGMYL